MEEQNLSVDAQTCQAENYNMQNESIRRRMEFLMWKI